MNIIPSTLKVVACETINIQKDLESTTSKNIDELLNEKKQETPIISG